MIENRLEKWMDSFSREQAEDLLQDIEVNTDRRLARKIGKMTRKRLGFAAQKHRPRWLIPIAACACAAIICTAVPPVRAAILDLFSRFNAQVYMGTPQAQRTAIPGVEALIQQPEQSKTHEVLLGEALPDWNEISEARAASGYSTFDASQFKWLLDIKPGASEVLYDGGNTLMVTGALQTENPLPFYAPYMDIPETDQRLSLNGATFTYKDDSGNTQTLHGVCNLQIFDEEASSLASNGEERVANTGYILSKGEVPFVAEFSLLTQTAADGTLDTSSPWTETTLPERVVDASLTLDINDSQVDDMGSIGKIAQVSFDISFDASESSTTATDVMVGQSISLTGSSIVTLNYSGSYFQDTFTCANEELSLDGMALDVTQVDQAFDSLTVYYTLHLPPDWSDETADAFLLNESGHAGLFFLPVADGAELDSCSPWMVSRNRRESE